LVGQSLTVIFDGLMRSAKYWPPLAAGSVVLASRLSNRVEGEGIKMSIGSLNLRIMAFLVPVACLASGDRLLA